MERDYDVVVIGGGPAGMICAATTALRGRKTILLEGNPSLGKKLLLTGGGRCNFTQAEPDVRVFTDRFGREGRALLSPMSKLSSMDTLEWFSQRGMNYKVEAQKRAFPTSDSAQSVLETLLNEMKRQGVHISLSSHVRSIQREEDLWVARTPSSSYRCQSIVLATGGLARPETGSTGDGFTWLEKWGVKVHRPDPSLVPILTKEALTKKWTGLGFDALGIRLIQKGKMVEKRTDKVLFTHFGLSGPGILNLSSKMKDLAKKDSLTIEIDFFPNMDEGELEKDIQRRFQAKSKQKPTNALQGLLPPRILSDLLEKSEVPTHIQSAQISRNHRKNLIRFLKHLPLTFRGTMGIEKAVVSSGGVDVGEVNFKNMEIKKLPGLFVCGDILNFNRPSGGYSLQICWCTGFTAGLAA